ncbi:hypothetical protein AXX12_11205 [Anaerosporomusa subterranea]|jgi:hypothetical protein|uniref:MazG-like family protein n=1 Tax=Anaerosporomusa subterranea TaxID=1794912 RepID=A0A154BPA4_ANASB|nr:MazG-like family protein [Anaerosporomusa subterranea]KYZ75766.1 hypothetical protein AXX12_11205 [Anaerosporomusa subterranea]MDF2500564.1 MazG-like domain containing protein [Anaerosporomusa subterranea]
MAHDSDILRKLRFIEWLKAELASNLAALLHAIVRNSERAMAEALAALIVTSYVLGRRLGLDFDKLDKEIAAWLARYTSKEHDIDKWTGDYAELERYLRQKR